LRKRIAPYTFTVKRSDVFDVAFEKFVHEPIKRPVPLPASAKKLGKELIDLGFTDNFTIGKAPALELVHRLQDVCNGFEPLSEGEDEDRVVTQRPLPENPKVASMLELLEEIDTEENQVVVWSSRTALLDAVCASLEEREIAYVKYNGAASARQKREAEDVFEKGTARVFVANQASAAYGLNCLRSAGYMIWMCVDGSVERYHQAMHRVLRGQLTAPKYAYSIYIKGSVEERMWARLRLGQELIGNENKREVFEFR
jgi:SNF2 family DNA or RNA helicase